MDVEAKFLIVQAYFLFCMLPIFFLIVYRMSRRLEKNFLKMLGLVIYDRRNIKMLTMEKVTVLASFVGFLLLGFLFFS